MLYDKSRQKSSGRFPLSVYDSQDLMEVKSASREYDVPVQMLERAIEAGTLRSVSSEGAPKLFRFDVENFVKRTVKRGYGNRVVSRINPTS
jgi:hypothetical protein